MIAFDTFLIFFITTFVVVISPGPAVLAVALESASVGIAKSFGVIFGIALGNVVFFILSATGIAALIVTSSLLFSIIKWIGVAYLFYLVLQQYCIDGYRAIQSVQDKAWLEGNGYSLDKSHNAVLDALGCSLRASQKAVIHVVALFVKGTTIPCKVRLVANRFLTRCTHQYNVVGVLGAMALFSKSGGLQFDAEKKQETRFLKAFLRGFILELSNPKALLYFSALLPQFIDIHQPIVPQLAILGLVTLMLDLICYSAYAYFSYHSTKHGLKPLTVKIINRTAGSFLIFAGLKMATVSHH